ncbi:hypothetical protein [Duganella phyllosphaerae]|uniref:Uncharacterized protein n=1 Tax=Duganella phyllosphaerae TaxID=762836 RepID=A0A1E7X7X3_9BURK|nr:hypothetical protein [Duganella phyllosphaerae]OFA09052.1 hypothetical protein DUPY_02940 [Duganella phyllosphaerae]
MFLNLELWDEEPRADQLPIIVGSAVDSYLDMKAMKAKVRPVNVFTIISFEHITIKTVGRPRSSENKQDFLTGVRIRLSDGTQHVVIDSKTGTFEGHIKEAKNSTEPVVNVGRSSYMSEHAFTQ